MIGVFNPTEDDVEKEWFDDDNEGHTAIAKSLQITFFEDWLGRLIARDIANKIFFERGQQKNYKDDTDALLKEIIVDEPSASIITNKRD